MDQISWWRTSFGEPELQKLRESVLNEHISQGAVTAEFEAQLAQALGVPYVVATTSGTIALLMALMALDIGPGDEVIVPNRTWIATAHAPLMLRAKVVLVDVQPDLPLMDVSQIRQKITPRTKAIMPVHLGGRAVDMATVHQIAEEYGLQIVEDAAQALFSKNSAGFLGTQSDVAAFSLSVAKLISTGQGGFIVTKNEKIYEKLKRIRTHGVADVINVSYTQLGLNFRFTDLQASFGVAQLTRVPDRIAHVQAVYARYAEGLEDLSFLKLIPIKISQGEIPLYIEILYPERDRLVEFLSSHGIQTRPFYPDLDQADYLENRGEFPHSRIFGTQGLFLPCGPDQSLENIDRVLEVLCLYGKQYH